MELTKVTWLIANKLTLNTAKSKAIIISPKLNSPTIEMDINCPLGIIKSVKSAKYLGVTLDEKLNFMSHIKTLEPKIARSVGILSKLKYYLPESALLKLYYSSNLNYGLPA